jgi:hypothetical protein
MSGLGGGVDKGSRWILTRLRCFVKYRRLRLIGRRNRSLDERDSIFETINQALVVIVSSAFGAAFHMLEKISVIETEPPRTLNKILFREIHPSQ